MVTVNLEVLLPFVIVMGLCIVLMVMVVGDRKKIAEMDKRLKRLTRGKNGTSLEAELIHLFESNDILTETAHDLQKQVQEHENRLSTCFCKVGVIKYDAFNQMGGKLSFALALLNEENDGVVLNSVHSPEGNFTYVKEILEGKSELELAVEEKQALDRALAQTMS
ncbi:MAG: DUF4446 family protein [Lachnospiraceae bacterium]|nr:DUF4446 family protein [Lachnospiraceae bacterium]